MSFLGIKIGALGKTMANTAKGNFRPVALTTHPEPNGLIVNADVLSQLSARGNARAKADAVVGAGKSFLRSRKQFTGYAIGAGLAAQGGTVKDVGLVRSSLGAEQKKGFDLAMAAKAGEAKKNGATAKDQFKSMVKAGVKSNWWAKLKAWWKGK